MGIKIQFRLDNDKIIITMIWWWLWSYKLGFINNCSESEACNLQIGIMNWKTLNGKRVNIMIKMSK